MKVHLALAEDAELMALMRARAAESSHTLCEDAREAELILFLGNPTHEPGLLLNHPLYRAYPDKCAIYCEDDEYLPLLPGVYCSAHKGAHTRSGRVVTWSYVSAGGRFANPYIAQTCSEKRFLFSFQGGSTSMLRKRMYRLPFNRPDVLIEDTSVYHHWDPSQAERELRQRTYAETMAASHFVLCPRGAGTGSIRLFEAMQAGIAPVLISDDYALPPQVPWETFLLRIAERDIHRLAELIEPHLAASAQRGQLAREAWLKYFAPEREFEWIVTLAAAALRSSSDREAGIRKQQRGMILRAKLRLSLRRAARAGILKTLRLLRLKSPYRLNR
jgi:hypothetical protein